MQRSEVRQFDVVRALFAPGETGDLKPEARRIIGQWVTCQAAMSEAPPAKTVRRSK